MDEDKQAEEEEKLQVAIRFIYIKQWFNSLNNPLTCSRKPARWGCIMILLGG
jgi:hypothetical protein